MYSVDRPIRTKLLTVRTSDSFLGTVRSLDKTTLSRFRGVGYVQKYTEQVYLVSRYMIGVRITSWGICIGVVFMFSPTRYAFVNLPALHPTFS